MTGRASQKYSKSPPPKKKQLKKCSMPNLSSRERLGRELVKQRRKMKL